MNEVSDLLVWGNNQSNLLSQATTKCIPNPIPLCLPFEINFICASQKHISFVTRDGKVYSYGINLDGRLGISTRNVDRVSFHEPVRVPIPGRVIKIQSGFSHICALNDRGELYAWGMGQYGALGTGEFVSRSSPTRIDLPREVVVGLKQISCGAMHTAFLTDQGDVFACGSNQYGQLGMSRPQKVSTPIVISFHVPVQQISCGVFYTLLLSREGKVYGMGNNKYGQLGTGHKVNESHPTLIRQLNDIVKVTAGYHSGAIDKFGNLYLWGSGSFGEFLKPKKYVLSVPIRDIAIRGFFGIAIGHTSRNQNRVYSWGNNTFGELGLGDYQPSKQPLEVEVLRGLQINKFSLGVNFAIVLLHPPEGQVWQENEWETSRRKVGQDQFYGAPISDRRSNQYYEQRYLHSDRGVYQNSVQFQPKDATFQVIQNERQSPYSRRAEYERQYYDNPDMRSPYHRSQRNSNSREREREKSPYGKFQNSSELNSNLTTKRKDYEKLFFQLSEDYQALVLKYTELESQIPHSKNFSNTAIADLQKREKQLLEQNLILKEENSKLSLELISTNDEIRARSRKNEQLILENEKLMFHKVNSNNMTLSPPITSQLEQEYKKLLVQKDQIISKLNVSIGQSQAEYKISVLRMSEQISSLKRHLNDEQQKNTKRNLDYQTLMNQMQVEIKKSQDLGNKIGEQNQVLKSQLAILAEEKIKLEDEKQKYNEIKNHTQSIKQQYDRDLKDSNLREEAMTGRIAELEIELKYEKQFSKKYQQTISTIKQANQKLHRDLQINGQELEEKERRIQNLKSDCERFKKYKKEVDDKNIQIEELIESMQNTQKKAKQMVQEKQKEVQVHVETIRKINAKYEQNTQKKQEDSSEMHKEMIRLEKQMIKNKENISSLKTQLAFKQDEVELLNQQKGGLEKKSTILSSELQKEIGVRQELVKEIGEVKRELSKMKLAHREIEIKIETEEQEIENLNKVILSKDEQIDSLQKQAAKSNERNENLKQQSDHYRSELEEISQQLNNETRINCDLSKANKQFAESQSLFNKKIAELESKIYQLEDEHKSYTPRYEALIIRNKELDEKNRELAEMVNKAIQMQAQSYRTNILKEVQINADNIINQVKEEQQFFSKNRRNRSINHTAEKQQEVQEFMTQRKENSSVKEEPYSKMMKDRISSHKRKVSQSAQKLASILELDGQQGNSEKFPRSNQRSIEDYQKINVQMESFSNQKVEFMQKIHSFAQKLKIL